VSTANAVVDSSSPIQAQLSAVHNNNDIGWYPHSAKAIKDEKSATFSQTRIQLHLNTISKKRERRAWFQREFSLWCRKGKAFCEVHLFCIVSNPERVSEMSMLTSLEIFLRTPMREGHLLRVTYLVFALFCWKALLITLEPHLISSETSHVFVKMKQNYVQMFQIRPFNKCNMLTKNNLKRSQMTSNNSQREMDFPLKSKLSDEMKNLTCFRRIKCLCSIYKI